MSLWRAWDCDSMQDVNEVIRTALSGLPCPASREPAAGAAEQYVSWFEVSATPTVHASNAAQRIVHVVQVDIYSKPHYHMLLAEVLLALKGAGLTVSEWGPEDYEEDTGYHHMPISVGWAQTIGGMNNA